MYTPEKDACYPLKKGLPEPVPSLRKILSKQNEYTPLRKICVIRNKKDYRINIHPEKDIIG